MAKLAPLTKEELEKKNGLDIKVKPISQEMFFISKIGYYYGWEGIVAYETNVIPHERMRELIEATEMVWHDQELVRFRNNFYSSNGAKAYTEGLKQINKRIKIDE